MKSTIKIDSGIDREPVIRIKTVNLDVSDDLRDKYLRMFFEGLLHTSSLAYIECFGVDKESQHYDIHPIPGNREGFKKYLSQCGGEQVRLIADVCKELIDSYPVTE